MDDRLEQTTNPVVRLERVGLAGTVRGTLAGFLGCGLWIGLLMLYINASAGTQSLSTTEATLVTLLAGLITVLPCMLSQMIRGLWVIEETGVHEKIIPLLSFLPFGLNRERLIRWQDIERYGIRQVTMRGKSTAARASRRTLYYFRAVVTGQPKIEIARKDKDVDDEFDRFTEEFSRRMDRSAEIGQEPIGGEAQK